MDTRLAFVLLVASLTIYSGNASNHTAEKIDRGCQLMKSKAVMERKEPKEEPIIVHATFRDLNLRDAPNKGGSFGVEFK